MQSLALLRQFLAVAKAGSVSAGAAALALSQPAVTKAIHRLEDELGVPLFDRRARGVVPTRFGEALLRHAKRIETEWDFAQAEVQAFRRGYGGQLRVGGGTFFGIAVLPVAIARLHERLPQLRVELTIGVNTVMLPRLIGGDVDLIMSRLPEPGEVPDYIQCEPIAEVRCCVIAAANHPLAGRSRVSVAALSSYPWVIYQEDREIVADMIATFERMGGQPPRIAVEATSLIALFQLLRSGPYVSCIAEGLLDPSFGHGLVELPVGASVSRFVGGAMFPRALAEVTPLKTLIALARETAAGRVSAAPGPRDPPPDRPARRRNGRDRPASGA